MGNDKIAPVPATFAIRYAPTSLACRIVADDAKASILTTPPPVPARRTQPYPPLSNAHVPTVNDVLLSGEIVIGPSSRSGGTVSPGASRTALQPDAPPAVVSRKWLASSGRVG